MLRSFDACRYPREEGGTEYSPALFEKLKYDIEGTFCITPYNPSAKNATVLNFANIDPEMTSKNTRICFLDDAGAKLSAPETEAAAAEPPTKRNRGPSEQQPRTIHDAIAARVAQQEKLLKNAANREKAKRGRGGGE
jgi:hypothetical protein